MLYEMWIIPEQLRYIFLTRAAIIAIFFLCFDGGHVCSVDNCTLNKKSQVKILFILDGNGRS